MVILDRGRVLVSGSVGEVIRAAVVERFAQVRVPRDLVEPAVRALADVPGLTVTQVAERPDVLRIALPGSAVVQTDRRDDGTNAALGGRERGHTGALVRGRRRPTLRRVPQADEGVCRMTARVMSADVNGSRDLGGNTAGDPGWLVVAGQECRDLWRVAAASPCCSVSVFCSVR